MIDIGQFLLECLFLFLFAPFVYNTREVFIEAARHL